MPSVSAHDVAAELRRQLPGVGIKKLHKLLYYCQGHHLAHFNQQLFREPVMAYDMGPLVANLWKTEKEGLPKPEPASLDAGQLNTVSYVVSRYGRLTGNDLERLTHNEEPWLEADVTRPVGGSVRIKQDTIKRFFQSQGAPESDLPWPTPRDLGRLVSGAEERRAGSPVVDDLSELRQRRARL